MPGFIIKSAMKRYAPFFKSVAEAMVNCSTKWSAYSEQSSMLSTDNNDKSGNDISVANTYNTTCIPAGLDIIPAKISVKMRVCQVCNYEMRRFKWKSVTLCTNHGVRLCTEKRRMRSQCEPKLQKLDGTPVPNWKWTCETDNTYWTKFHEFYLLEGLINNNFSLQSPHKCKFAGVQYTSSLHQLKYEALGDQVKVKTGNTAGVGRINEKAHIIASQKHDLQY
jgi:hypothetical protein